LSYVIASVEAIVGEAGSFPAGVDPNGPFDGAMMLRVDKGFSVRWRYEVSLGRYETIRVKRFSRLSDAARAVAESWRDGIDGVPVDVTS
jgi:hypothetical protein